MAPWLALQRWLELAGETRVVIPFARALANLLPATSVRMRRDFLQLLMVIKTIALLYQLQRERDDNGRIIASMEDYAKARWLLEEVFAATVAEGLTKGVRETVEAVAQLSQDGTPVTQRELATKLGLSKSTVSYRVRRALKGGWLIDKADERRGPSQLVLGDPLPDASVLPEPYQVSACADELKAIRTFEHQVRKPMK